MTWRDKAACRGMPPAERIRLFFDGGSGNSRAWRAEIAALCGPCPVRALCLASAMKEEEDTGLRLGLRFGVRGGLTPGARYRLGAQRQRRAS